jgi:hypothetical protein
MRVHVGELPLIADALRLEIRTPIPSVDLPFMVSQLIQNESQDPDLSSPLLAEVLFAPVVIVEESDPRGRAFGTLVTQAFPSYAYIAEGHGALGLIVLYETSLILLWFAGGPAQGLRDAAESAARKVSEPYFEELLQSFVDRRQGRRAQRRERDRED